MICKDCYHCDVCGFEGCNDNALTFCKDFKDKDLIAELPCRIGEELFLIDYPTVHCRLKRYELVGTRIVMVIECFELQSILKRVVDKHFGVTVFLTKEEAEAKLKELKND